MPTPPRTHEVHAFLTSRLLPTSPRAHALPQPFQPLLILPLVPQSPAGEQTFHRGFSVLAIARFLEKGF